MNCSRTGSGSFSRGSCPFLPVASSWVNSRCLLVVVAITSSVTPLPSWRRKSSGLSRGRPRPPGEASSLHWFLVFRSVGGTSLPGRGGLAQGFVNQACDLDTLLHALVEHELHDRREAGFQARRQLRLHEPRRAAQPVQGQLLLLGCTHDRDVH